tara:strand:- start:167 stop:436 length:270 start_codon:yes stop_codon:yes gene_type:complete
MGRRFTVPGQYANQREVVGDGNNRRSAYITDIIYTGGLPSAYATDGGAVTIGPVQTQLSSTYNWHFSTPIAAPTGFVVPAHHQVIYYFD